LSITKGSATAQPAGLNKRILSTKPLNKSVRKPMQMQPSGSGRSTAAKKALSLLAHSHLEKSERET